MDFVPIENNSDDFDLAKIIDNINQKNNDVQLAIAPIQNPDLNTCTKSQSVDLQVAIPIPNQANQPSISNNFTNMQNFPILPKMIFPNSNVTINYNFSK